jgi:hypothetical protein
VKRALHLIMLENRILKWIQIYTTMKPKESSSIIASQYNSDCSFIFGIATVTYKSRNKMVGFGNADK